MLIITSRLRLRVQRQSNCTNYLKPKCVSLLTWTRRLAAWWRDSTGAGRTCEPGKLSLIRRQGGDALHEL